MFRALLWNVRRFIPALLRHGSAYALLLDFKNGIYQQTRTRTNLLLWSQAMATSPWTNSEFPSNTVLTNNAGTAPDGSSTATSVSPGTQFGNAKQSVNLTPGVTYTYSVWIKVLSGNTSLSLTNYNAATYLAGNNGSQINTISATSIWQRYSSTFTVDTRIVGSSSVYVQDRNASGFGTFLVWGAQLEAAPAASAYIPTTSAAVSVTESITDQTPVRTNFITNSFPAAGTGWSISSNTGVSANAIAVSTPFAGLATKLYEADAVVNYHWTGQSVTLSAGTYTLSCYAKAVERRYVWLEANGLAFNAVFDLQTGTVVTNAAGTTAAITGGANGEYRCAITFSAPPTTISARIGLTNTTSVASYAGAANSGAYVWAAQLERSFSAATYIDNTTASPLTVGAVTDLYGYTYSRSGAKEEVGTTYGPELVTNGGFDTNTNGWSANNCTLASVNGQLVETITVQAAPYGYTTFPTVVGKTYSWSVTLVGATAPNGQQIRFGSSAGASDIQQVFPAKGSTAASTFTATTATTYLSIGYGETATGQTSTWDNVSVKEVIPASSFAANVPAIIPGTGYFARPAYTNLLLRSQTFEQAPWSLALSTTVTTGSAVAPDGSTTAETLTKPATAFANVQQAVTSTINTVYTVSVFVKAGSLGTVTLRNITGSVDVGIGVNLTTGVISNYSGAPTNTFATSVGNGWWRIGYTFTSDATATTLTTYLYPGDAAAAVAGTVYAWQAQLVQASDPGPIIVTTSATAAVGADVMALTNYTVPTGDFLLAAVSMISTATSVQNDLVELSDGTTNNRIVLYKTNSGNPGLAVNPQNTGYRTAQGAATVNSGQRLTLACFYSSSAGTFKLAYKVDNSAPVVLTAVASPFPTLNKLTVGVIGSGTTEFVYGPVQTVLVRPGTFSDTDLTNILTAL